MDCSLPNFSVHGILQAKHWSGLPLPPSGHLSDPGMDLGSPALQADSLPTELSGKPISFHYKGEETEVQGC